MSESSIDGRPASATSNVIHVDFRGDPLDVIRDENGVWVPVKRVCDALALDVQAQVRRLGRQAWATTAMMAAVAADGKVRQTTCLHLDSLPMWLATIETSRVAPEAREKLIAYQCHCAKVLRDAVFGTGEAATPRSPELPPPSSHAEPSPDSVALNIALGGNADGTWDRSKAMGELIDELILVQAAGKYLQDNAGGKLLGKAIEQHSRNLRRRLQIAAGR